MRPAAPDAHDGLAGAAREACPEATWQRRVARARRDVPAKIDGREAQRRARAVMSPIFRESDPTLVRAPCHEAAGELASFAPDASRVPGDAGAGALAYLSFPREHRTKIRTNNVQERTSCEPRRRTKVVQTFPSTGSVLRLLGGIVDEADADWASENLLVSKESPGPVLGLERAERRIEGFAPSEEVRKRAEAVMMVALDEYAKAS